MTAQLREALAAANVAPLIQKQIDPLLLEYQRRYSPFLRVCPSVAWGSNTYFFNQRTVRPRGGAVVDGGARAVTSSTYVQSSFAIKLFQSVGAVTGFAQAVTRDLIGDLKAREVEGASSGLLWDIETGLLWGSAGATASGVQPQPDGLDVQVSTYSGSTQNALDQAHAALALRHFDLLIDNVEENAAMAIPGSDYMFLVSPAANSKVAQLLTNQQRFMQVEVAAGLNVPTYRDIPFIKSSFLAARSQALGAVTTGTATSGGTLAAATYYYRVSAIMERFGETAACTEVSQTTTGSTSTVTLTVTTPSGPDGAQPLQYKVYRSTTTGTETLQGVVDAYDTTGAAVTSIIDTGTNLLTNSSGNTGPAAYVATNAGQSPRNTSDEDVYLVPRNPDFMVRPYIRDLEFINLAPTTSAPDTLPFALVSDTCLAIRAPKYVSRLSRIQVSL